MENPLTNIKWALNYGDLRTWEVDMVMSEEESKEIDLLLVVAVVVVGVLLVGTVETSEHCCLNKNGFLNCAWVLIGTFEEF